MPLSQVDVVRKFLDGKSASGSNFHSDGVSLWSYGWYELARHVGRVRDYGMTPVLYVRAPSSTYSSSTAGQLHHLRARQGLYYGLTVPAATNEAVLSQPNWWLVSLVAAADSYIGRPRNNSVRVAIKPTAKFPGDSAKCALRNGQAVITVRGVYMTPDYETVVLNGLVRSHDNHVLVESVDGNGARIRLNALSVPGWSSRVEIPADKLYRVDENIKLSTKLAARDTTLFPGYPWADELFPDMEVTDIREQFILNEEQAYRYPSPYERSEVA